MNGSRCACFVLLGALVLQSMRTKPGKSKGNYLEFIFVWNRIMLKITNCHIIKFPSGRWGYVGTIPLCLGVLVPADTSAVLGCRTIPCGNGPMMFKAKTFETETRNYATIQGVTLAN